MGVFEIEATADAAGGERGWQARRNDTGENVELRFVRSSDPLREDAWTRLRGIDLPQLARAMERIAVEDGFVEANASCGGETLRAWRAKRPKADVATIEAFVAQLAEAIGALHAHGLVHLGLTPETIFAVESGGETRFVVGGFGRVAVSDRTDRLALEIDPLYAPPEAATLKEHPPGATLCAWDWWTLGRVTQELWLGRHIFAPMLGGDPTRPTPEARAKAEEYLLERDGLKGMRAGAVELMAPLDARIDLLLRGLLTSAVESRWSSEFVDRWVRKMPAKEGYTGPRNDAWFRWRGRPWTPEEIAAVLRTPAEWAGATEQIWEAGKRGTLAHFLKQAQTEALKKTQARLVDLLALATTPGLKGAQPEVVREALTAVALAQLAGAPVVWRGEKLSEVALEQRIGVVRVLALRPILLEIERCDVDTARWIGELAKNVADAETLVRRAGTIGSADGDVTAAIFALAWQSPAELAAQRDELRKEFPLSTQAVAQRLIASDKLTRVELMALAWMAREPRRFGFITAVEAQKGEAATLRVKGAAVAAAWFWARLEGALASGPLVYGGLGMFFGVWAFAAVAAIAVWPGIAGVGLALGVVGGMAALRAAASSAIGTGVRRFSPEARAWGWGDGAGRCHTERVRLPENGDAKALAAAHAEANAALAKLSLVEPKPQPMPEPPSFTGARLAGIAGWAVLLGVVALLGWRVKTEPPSLEAHRMAWGLPESGARDPNAPVLVSWPYRPGGAPETMTVVRSFEASKPQLKEMLERGKAKVAPYRPETISTMAVLTVPGAEPSAVMIFDGKRGVLVNQKIYVLSYRPLERAWIEITDFKGTFLPD